MWTWRWRSNFASTAQVRAAQFDILGNGKSAKLAWQTQDYNPAGAVGNAAAPRLTKVGPWWMLRVVRWPGCWLRWTAAADTLVSQRPDARAI